MPINLPNLEERSRSFVFKPETADENTRTVRAVIATDSPVVSTEQRTGRGVLEVWRMDGLEPFDKAPLLDGHNDKSVRNVLGSISDPQVQGGEATARVQISEAEPNVWTKVREGHICDVSGRCQPLEMEAVQRGTTRSVRGATYTAPRDRDLNVITKWRMREVSLVPIGADPRAKIRSEGEATMLTETCRSYLTTIGLAKDATEEQAKAFYDSLPEVTRGLADAYTPAGAPIEVKSSPKREETTRSEPAIDADKIHAEAIEADRRRRKEIERLGAGLPEETVRKAADELTIEQAKDLFLEKLRNRTDSANPGGPAIHAKDDQADARAIGLALAMRDVSGEQLYRSRGAYVPVGREKTEDGRPADGYRLRRARDDEAHKKGMEKLLDQADEFAGMSLVDVCRMACELDGKRLSLRTSYDDVIRTAVSGSALSVIFTTNINAQFLTGYTDYYDSTTGWCSEADVNNFLTNERDTMGKFGALKKVTKGRPAEHLDTSDWKESYKITRYGGQFVIDEQDIINDRFGALESESPKDMGLTAAQLRPNLVYGIMLANAVLDVDGVALFDTNTHANYAADASSANAGGPLGAGSMQAAIQAMGKQRINSRPLNIRPRFLIVPQDLKFTAGILLKSAERIISTSDGGTYNPLKDLEINLVVDDRIGVAGVVDPTGPTARAGTAVNWFLAARPGEEGAKTIEVGYRRGTGRAPMIRSFVLDKGQWGMGWDINFDIGAKALDYRGLYKSKGSA